MKNALLSIVLALCCLTLFAQNKVLERSGSKPGWIDGVEAGYIIVSSRSAAVEDAKAAALNQVKDLIITSVAENVSSSSTLSTQEHRTDNGSFISEQYISRVKTSTPIVPFLKGISISKAVDFYWEKVKEPNGTESIIYHLKYPFNDDELHDLISEFNMYQKRYDMELIDIEGSLQNLEALSVDSLIFLNGRLSLLQSLVSPMQAPLFTSCKSKIQAIINDLYVNLVSNSNNHIAYSIKYGQESLRCYIKPKIKTECTDAAFFKTEDGMLQQIILPTFYCKSEKKYTVEITYSLAGKSLKHVFTLDVEK